jgi:hypothetical protein
MPVRTNGALQAEGRKARREGAMCAVRTNGALQAEGRKARREGAM